MKKVEKVAKEGFKLTKAEETSIEKRIYVSRVLTTNPESWHEVPISEFEEWKKEMEKVCLPYRILHK